MISYNRACCLTLLPNPHHSFSRNLTDVCFESIQVHIHAIFDSPFIQLHALYYQNVSELLQNRCNDAVWNDGVVEYWNIGF